MTTDPTPLHEQIARSLALTDDYDGCFERLDGTDPEGPLSTDEEDAEWWRKRAAAVLPIIAAEVQGAKAEAVDEFAAALADHLDLATPRAWDFRHPCDPVRWEPNARDLALMGVADMLRNDTRNPYRAARRDEEKR